MNYVVESNAVLKVKFQKLHSIVVGNINAANIIDFLFRDEVFSSQDVRALQRQYDSQQQCRDLLSRLQRSKHGQAFVQLYCAIRSEPHLQWLVDAIDNFRDQSVVDVLQKHYRKDPTGKFEASVICKPLICYAVIFQNTLRIVVTNFKIIDACCCCFSSCILALFVTHRTFSSAMAERPCKLGDFRRWMNVKLNFRLKGYVSRQNL